MEGKWFFFLCWENDSEQTILRAGCGWSSYFSSKITCLFTQKCQRASVKSVRSLELAQLPGGWKFLPLRPLCPRCHPIIVDSLLNFILLLNSVLKWSDIKFEEDTEILFFYLFILFITYIKTTLRKVFTGIISKIYLDIILHWAALLSVHIKEHLYINNKHKKLWETRFSCPRPKL